MARTKNRYRKQTSEETPLQTYRTGIYIRLSKERTETWRNKSQSLETQESLARAFAKEKGLTVTKCYIDYEYSGTTFNRPAYKDMMDDLKKGIINCILIRDLSRLGRNYIEMGRLIDKVFPFMGVRFISINDNLDTLNGLGDKKSLISRKLLRQWPIAKQEKGLEQRMIHDNGKVRTFSDLFKILRFMVVSFNVGIIKP